MSNPHSQYEMVELPESLYGQSAMLHGTYAYGVHYKICVHYPIYHSLASLKPNVSSGQQSLLTPLKVVEPLVSVVVNDASLDAVCS